MASRGTYVAGNATMQNDVLTENQSRSRRFAPLGIIFGLLGLVLFVYFVRHAGVSEIVLRIQRLGAGFILILAVSSLRYKVDSNHDIVYLDFAEPTLTVQEIRAIFRKLGLEPRIVGAIPTDLNPKSKTQPLRI